MSYQTAQAFIVTMKYEEYGQNHGLINLELEVNKNHTPKDATEILAQLKGEVRFIEVDGLFGKKKVSQDDFAKEWVEHAKQLWKISYDTDWMERVSAFIFEVEKQAELEFDRVWTQTNITDAE
jgi:hypothetical protein